MKKGILIPFILSAVILGGCQGNQTPAAPEDTTTNQLPAITGEAQDMSTTTQESSTPEAGTATQETQKKGLTVQSLSVADFQDINVSMTKNGFEPAEITIQAGTKVVFTNNDTETHWPASDPHPVHTTCPYFDARSPIAPGQTAEFTFYSTASCPYHDHLNPGVKGLVTVE